MLAAKSPANDCVSYGRNFWQTMMCTRNSSPSMRRRRNAGEVERQGSSDCGQPINNSQLESLPSAHHRSSIGFITAASNISFTPDLHPWRPVVVAFKWRSDCRAALSSSLPRPHVNPLRPLPDRTNFHSSPSNETTFRPLPVLRSDQFHVLRATNPAQLSIAMIQPIRARK